MFPALYLASDKGTALAEVLGRDKNVGSLTPEELALTKPDSISAVSVSGKLESVLDVRRSSNLSALVSLIKSFRLSRSLIMEARTAGLPVATNYDRSRAETRADVQQLEELANAL